MGLRRGEKEDDVLRRLLQSLEEGVKSSYGEHMDLVYDVDLVGGLGRREYYFFAYPSYVVDTVIGSRVDLYNVKEGPVQDTLTDGAFVTRIAVYGILAVYCSGEDLGYTGLTCSPLSRKEICVADPAQLDCLSQG